MNVYQAIHRYAEISAALQPKRMPVIAVKTGMYAIAYKHLADGDTEVRYENSSKICNFINMLLEEFFA